MNNFISSHVMRAAVGATVSAVLMLFALSSHAQDRRCLSECKSRIGIISAFGAEAQILLAQTEKKHDWRINGNRFTTGELKGNRVVIVLSGVSIVNAAMVTQLMIDHFRIERLVMSGIAGGVNPSGHIGDVIVPERWAMPMELYWNGDGSVPVACGKAGQLDCLGLKLAAVGGKLAPDFKMSTPNGSVSSGMFVRDSYVLTDANAPKGEFRFDYLAAPDMLAVARMLTPTLHRCAEKSETRCVSLQPQLKVGGRGVSGSAFVANSAYRRYLFETLQAEAVDMETAAFAQVAYANQIPFIAFRSVSDLAGGDDVNEVGTYFGSGLAEANEAAVTLAFLDAWKRRSARK